MALSRDQLQRVNQQRVQQGAAPQREGASATQQARRPQGGLAAAYAQGQQDESGGFVDTARDVGIDLAQGALRLPGAAAGLADIGPAGVLAQRPVSRAASAVGEATGFRPGQWAEDLDQFQSEALTQSQANVEQAFEGTETALGEGRYGDALAGAGRGALALAANPRALMSTVLESVPSMLAGGLAGRGVQALAGTRAAGPTLQGALQRVAQEGGERVGQTVATGQAAQQAGLAAGTIQQVPRLGGVPAAGIGEGAVMAGMAMDDMDEDVDPRRAALAAGVVGIGGGLLGAGGGRLAERLGVLNPEQIAMGRAGRAGTDLGRGRNLPARVAGGFVSEGLFEEMPQETLETVAGNWAEGEPLFNNVPRAAIEGMMAGGVMGGAMNIRRPRGADVAPTDLTGQPAQPEGTGPAGPQRFSPEGAEVSDMMRYHRRLSQVATEATEHPELQQQALERIEGVLNELDKRGIPREVVNEELAKKKYRDIEDQATTLASKYRAALQTNPQQARTYLDRLQGLTQQRQMIEQQYDRQALLGPDFETAQRLKEDPLAADLFRSVQGERTNQLKPSAQRRLTEFREMDPDQLLREVARDLEDGEIGAQVDRWAPLREAAARDRGFTEEQIREAQRMEYGARDTEAVTDEDVDRAFGGDPSPISDEDAEAAAAALTAGSDTELAVQDRAAEQDVSRETPPDLQELDQRWEQFVQVSNQSPSARDAMWAIGEAIAESEAGFSAGTALQRAAELYQQRRPNVRNPRQAMDNALKKLTPRLRQLTGNQDLPDITPQSIITNFAQSQASEDVGTEAGTLDGQSFDEAGGSFQTVSSAGGTTLSAEDRRETARGIRDSVNAQITRTGAVGNVAAATEQAQQWAAENADRMTPETQAQLAQELAAARTPAQVATAMRKVRNEVVESLTSEATGAAPARQRLTPEVRSAREAERQQQQAEVQQAAEQRQQERQQALTTDEFTAQARQALAMEDSRRAGGKWNKRANAWWAELVPDSPMLTWDEMVDQYTLEALNWVASVNEIDNDMQMEPDAKRDALRQLFEDFADGFASGQAQANPEGLRLLAGPAAASDAATGAATAAEPGTAAAEAGPGPAVEPDETNPGAEVVESRETQAERSDRYSADPAAAFLELQEAMADLDIAIEQAQQERSTYDKKKLERVRKEVNQAITGAQSGNVTPEAAAKAVHDTYETVAPVAADRARDEALAEKARKRAEREERTRKVAPETYTENGETFYVAKTGKPYANANAANLQRHSKRFKQMDFKPDNLKVVEVEGGFALQFVSEPSVQARNFSLHQSAQEAIGEQTGAPTALDRAFEMEDVFISIRQRENAGNPVTVDELIQMVSGLGSPGSTFAAQLQELGELARGQAVRVSFDNRFAPQNSPKKPAGYYDAYNEVVWFNEALFRSHASDLIVEMTPLHVADPADYFVETVTHELLHMGTINAAMALDKNHPLRQELRSISNDIREYLAALRRENVTSADWTPTARQEYIAFRLSLMSDERLQSEGLTHGELESITYGLTDPVMQQVMANMPAHPTREGRREQSMLRRFVDWVRGLMHPMDSPVGLSESMYARVQSVTADLLEMDDGVFRSEVQLDEEITGELWEEVRRMESALDSPFRDQQAQEIVDQFQPEIEEAISRAEESWIEVMQQRVLGNTDPEAASIPIIQTQRALRDAMMRFEAVTDRLSALAAAEDGISLPPLESATVTRDGDALRFRNPIRMRDGSRLSGFTNDDRGVFFGYDRNGEVFTLRRELVNPDDIVGSRDSNRTADRVKRGFKTFSAAYEHRRVTAPAREEKASAWARRMFEVLPDKIADAAIDTHDRIRGLGMLTMFTSQFVDYAERWLPTVRSYYDTIRWRISERNSIHTKIQETVGEVANWSHERRKQLNGFLAESTYRGKWGFQPDWLPNASVDATMADRFSRMDADQQRVAIGMFRQAHTMHVALQRELRGDIERVFDESIARATQPNRIAKLTSEKADALAAHDSRQNDFRDAYLPLKRWGKWAVVYKSQAFKDAEQQGNRRQIDRLKQDESHYMVSFADTQYAARQLRREWEAEKGTTIEDPFPRMRYDEKNELVPFDLLQRLKQNVSEGVGVQQGISSKLDEALNRVYIEALSESSVRKSELRRIGVRGFDEDMVRSFVQHGQGVASLTSAIRINWQTRQHINNMKDEAQGSQQRKDSMAALNEILARHAASLEPEEPGIQQRMMGMTSVWMLLTSPAYYIQNSTQPFMLTLPTLAARFGFSKSSAHMTKAYKDIGTAWHGTRKDITRQGDLMDPDKIADADERDLIATLQGLNQMDVGIAADLGSLSDARTGTMRLLNMAHRKMVTGVRTVEVFNRGVTALASYRLAVERNMQRGMPAARAKANAKAYAIKQVEDTQGDYSGQNAPRLISKIPAGRLVTQFRKFQLIQIGLLVRTVHQAFKGASQEEKAVGRRQLSYILGAHAAVGGLTGLPAANIISMAVGMAFGLGDDDEPAGVEMRVRRAIGDKGISDLILQGLPAWAGIDASNRLGMGMTFSILPFTDVDLTRDGFATLAGTLLLGPTGAVGGSMLQGMGKWMSGDIFGGTADMMPAGLKNAMKAYSYATEGIETRTGITAITAEELNWFDLAAQAAGWPSKAISDRYEMYGMLLETEEFFRERTGRIKRAYTEAYEEGDSQEMSEAREEWRRLQRTRRDYNVGQPQSLSELIKAPREKREKEAAMIGGVPTERTTRRFVQELWE